MSECKYTCFDRVMHLVKELPEDTLRGAYEIATDYSFTDFLDFCVTNNCFTEKQAETLYEGIVMWEDLEGDYWEKNEEKLMLLYDKVGLTREVCEQFNEEKIRITEIEAILQNGYYFDEEGESQLLQELRDLQALYGDSEEIER